MRNDKGFSLIELLVVIAVILIIAAIAIPNFLSSRLRANETSAVASLRVINTAAVTYSITYPDRSEERRVATEGRARPSSVSYKKACWIDDLMAQGRKVSHPFVCTGVGSF